MLAANAYHSFTSEQSLMLMLARNNGNIAEHDSYWSFASDSHQSLSSKQSLISAELEDGEEYRKYSETYCLLKVCV